jgi:hypothetical protein
MSARAPPPTRAAIAHVNPMRAPHGSRFREFAGASFSRGFANLKKLKKISTFRKQF